MVFRSQEEADIHQEVLKAQRALETAQQARRKFGSRNTLHAVMSATKVLDKVKKNEMI